MRKHRRNGIAHVKWRLANPNTPLWVLSLNKMFRRIWADAAKAGTQTSVVIEANQYKKLINEQILTDTLRIDPPIKTAIGVDIAEIGGDKNAYVIGNMRPDGSVDIVKVDISA